MKDGQRLTMPGTTRYAEWLRGKWNLHYKPRSAPAKHVQSEDLAWAWIAAGRKDAAKEAK